MLSKKIKIKMRYFCLAEFTIEVEQKPLARNGSYKSDPDVLVQFS